MALFAAVSWGHLVLLQAFRGDQAVSLGEVCCSLQT